MSHETLSPAACAIRAFGGVRATARAAGTDPSNVSKWKHRGMVPTHLQKKLLAKAEELGLPLTAQDLITGRSAEASA